MAMAPRPEKASICLLSPAARRAAARMSFRQSCADESDGNAYITLKHTSSNQYLTKDGRTVRAAWAAAGWA